MPGGAQVDDTQPGMTENARVIRTRPKAAIVRTAMDDAGNKRVHRLPARPTRAPAEFPRYASTIHRKAFFCSRRTPLTHQSGAITQATPAATAIPAGNFIKRLKAAD